MVSNRDRQRAAARARLEQKMAERAEYSRLRKRRQTMIGAGAGSLVVILGVVWLVVAVATSDDSKKNASATSPTGCVWNPLTDPNAPDQSPPAGVRDVGTPPTDPPREGKSIMTIASNLGVVKIEMDSGKAPCAVASFTHLAGKNFFDGTKCHRLVPEIYALQCGDPVGDGTGGPTYRYNEENLPGSDRPPAYPKGSVAIAKAQAKGTNGSQFFFVYNEGSTLPGNYTLLGKVVEGLDILQRVAAAGHDDAFAGSAGGGHPKNEFILQKVTVAAAGAQPAVSESGSPTSPVPSSPAAS